MHRKAAFRFAADISNFVELESQSNLQASIRGPAFPRSTFPSMYRSLPHVDSSPIVKPGMKDCHPWTNTAGSSDEDGGRAVGHGDWSCTVGGAQSWAMFVPRNTEKCGTVPARIRFALSTEKLSRSS